MQWYRELNKTERRTFIAAFGGWAIDALDFMVFTFVIATLMTLWGIDKGQAGMLGTVTLLFFRHRRMAGGHPGGPVRPACACCNTRSCGSRLARWPSASRRTSSSFFVLRALQGLGFGGEWAVGSVLMGEIVRAEHRGKAVGHRTKRMGSRVGRRGHPVHGRLFHPAGGVGLAQPVLDRRTAGLPGAVHPQERARARGVPACPGQGAGRRGPPHRSGRSSRPRC